MCNTFRLVYIKWKVLTVHLIKKILNFIICTLFTITKTLNINIPTMHRIINKQVLARFRLMNQTDTFPQRVSAFPCSEKTLFRPNVTPNSFLSQINIYYPQTEAVFCIKSRPKKYSFISYRLI